MDKIPYKIKEKLRQYNKAVLKASQLADELDAMIEQYGVPIDNLIACDDYYSGNPQTEALAFIHNGECKSETALEEAICEIEEVFLSFVNK